MFLGRASGLLRSLWLLKHQPLAAGFLDGQRVPLIVIQLADVVAIVELA